MIYNGTCLSGGGGAEGGDCNAMRAGSFSAVNESGGTGGGMGIRYLEDCVARVKKCKYGNYVSFQFGGGPFSCAWSETCATLGTPQFCVDCSAKPNGSCAALHGKCPGFIQFYTQVIRDGPPAHPPLPNFTCSTPVPSPRPGPPPPPPAPAPPPPAAGTPWGHVGPWNIFDDKDNKGEAGTLAAAASPEKNPNLIYTGGHNNGVSSGILKSVDGGVHWTRNSTGMWDTRIISVFVHPSDPMGSHVLAGTYTGIYESKDGAGSWKLLNETIGWGIISFQEITIGGKQYIAGNTGSFIATVPVSGGLWQKTKNTGTGVHSGNTGISAVTTAGKSEIVTCASGKLYYGSFDAPTQITWSDPVNYTKTTFKTWSMLFAHQTYDVYDSCSCTGGCHGQPNCTGHCTCTGHWHYLGNFRNSSDCLAAVNRTDLGFKPAAYTFKGRVPGPGNQTSGNEDWSDQCYASDNFDTYTPPQRAGAWANSTVNADVGQSYSGRGPGTFPVNSTNIECKNAAVNPNDRNHLIYSDQKTNYNWDSYDGGKTVNKMAGCDGAAGDPSPNTPASMRGHNHGAYYVGIDGRGWSHSASMGGAYVSRDNGSSWDALHMVMTPRGHENNSTDWPLVNRVVHDYQGISTGFRGDSVAYPSDQGLGLLDGLSNNLTNAVGDLHNSMAMSALISPSKDGKSRNIVVNLWDWNQAFTIDGALLPHPLMQHPLIPFALAPPSIRWCDLARLGEIGGCPVRLWRRRLGFLDGEIWAHGHVPQIVLVVHLRRRLQLGPRFVPGIWRSGKFRVRTTGRLADRTKRHRFLLDDRPCWPRWSAAGRRQQEPAGAGSRSARAREDELHQQQLHGHERSIDVHLAADKRELWSQLQLQSAAGQAANLRQGDVHGCRPDQRQLAVRLDGQLPRAFN